jgi:hypothetical protein
MIVYYNQYSERASFLIFWASFSGASFRVKAIGLFWVNFVSSGPGFFGLVLWRIDDFCTLTGDWWSSLEP